MNFNKNIYESNKYRPTIFKMEQDENGEKPVGKINMRRFENVYGQPIGVHDPKNKSRDTTNGISTVTRNPSANAQTGKPFNNNADEANVLDEFEEIFRQEMARSRDSAPNSVVARSVKQANSSDDESDDAGTVPSFPNTSWNLRRRDTSEHVKTQNSFILSDDELSSEETCADNSSAPKHSTSYMSDPTPFPKPRPRPAQNASGNEFLKVPDEDKAVPQRTLQSSDDSEEEQASNWRQTPPIQSRSKPANADFVPAGKVVILGIEGKNNSSALDSVLMSMFLCQDAFMSYVKSNTGGKGGDSKHISKIMDEHVIQPLRADLSLKFKSGGMERLREELCAFDKRFSSRSKQMMDPDEIVKVVFGDVLKWPAFFESGDGEGGHVLQTYHDQRTMRGTTVGVQRLLDHTLRDSGMTLRKLPHPGLMLKLPFTFGKSVFQEIIPNYEITLKEFLTGKHNQGNVRMCLSAAICLKDDHFSTFIRTEGPLSSWVYLDSFNFRTPKTIGDFKARLEDSIADESYLNKEDLSWLKFLLENVYMCIYVPL